MLRINIKLEKQGHRSRIFWKQRFRFCFSIETPTQLLKLCKIRQEIISRICVKLKNIFKYIDRFFPVH